MRATDKKMPEEQFVNIINNKRVGRYQFNFHLKPDDAPTSLPASPPPLSGHRLSTPSQPGNK